MHLNVGPSKLAPSGNSETAPAYKSMSEASLKNNKLIFSIQ